jgi:hypothetical protein
VIVVEAGGHHFAGTAFLTLTPPCIRHLPFFIAGDRQGLDDPSEGELVKNSVVMCSGHETTERLPIVQSSKDIGGMSMRWVAAVFVSNRFRLPRT